MGGFVRDLILGYPSQDVDFVVFEGNMDELIEEIALETNAKIGKMKNKTLTTQLRFDDGIVCEFNSTRKEIYRFPNRTPIVSRGSLLDDLQRRDFTINTFILFDDTYIDVFNGTEDLNCKIIETTREPDVVFYEDYLRILRAIRFASKLDFSLSERVKKGIIRNVKNLLQVPKERILNELIISLKTNPVNTFILMRELNILETLFPDIMNEFLNPDIYAVQTIWEKIETKLKYLANKFVDEVILYIVVIFMETSLKDSVENNFETILIKKIDDILRENFFSNKDRIEILTYVEHRNSLINLLNHKYSKLEIRQLLRILDEKINNLLLLTEAELSTMKESLNFSHLKRFIDEVKENQKLIHFKLAINGHELKEIFGFTGKKIQELKSELSNAIMREEIKNTKDECIKYLTEKLS